MAQPKPSKKPPSKTLLAASITVAGQTVVQQGVEQQFKADECTILPTLKDSCFSERFFSLVSHRYLVFFSRSSPSAGSFSVLSLANGSS